MFLDSFANVYNILHNVGLPLIVEVALPYEIHYLFPQWEHKARVSSAGNGKSAILADTIWHMSFTKCKVIG